MADVAHSRKAHRSGNARPPNGAFARPSFQASPQGFTGVTRSRFPEVSHSDFRSRLLLAPSPGLSQGYYAEIQNGVLGG
jgi:hypothetical protein